MSYRGGLGPVGVPVYILAIPPYFLWFSKRVFHEVFHMRAYRWGASRLTYGVLPGLPLGERKKAPTAGDTVRALVGGW